MKKIILYCILLLTIFFNSGCKKFLDVNNDPNDPADVSEPLLLAPIETTMATTLTAGSWTVGNYGTLTVIEDYWTQQLALNQIQPQFDTYKVRPDDIDQMFLTIYSSILNNSKILNEKAETNGNYSYAVISKILTAYTLGETTDAWGDLPYSQAFNGNLHASYDSQETIYTDIQSLLDSAISENETLPAGELTPGADDFIYNGNMSKWEKFAYTLKARYYMHLTKAPGHTASAQATLALAALQHGFASNADEANFSAYSNSAGSESPWNENINAGQGGVVMASTFVNNLIAKNDPRLPIMCSTDSFQYADDGTITSDTLGTYVGRVIGSAPAADFTVAYSTVNNFYSAPQAPLSIVSYSEALFLQAEATLITSGSAAANPSYTAGIISNMKKLGVDTTLMNTYVANNGTLDPVPSNALQMIIDEKFVANFLSSENFTDWRRTGFPTLSIISNPFVPTMPRRFPYPLAELNLNQQPQQSAVITDRVWWDTP
jgi:hypothetical protein